MHLNCPHCRNPIEIVEPRAEEELVCPSCGSSFQIDPHVTIGQSTTDYQQHLGRYVLLTRVGVGAFGAVWKARDTGLDRIVALKVPRANNVAAGQSLDRFIREARSVAQLRHASIVPVHDVGEHEGTPFIVSEFVEGVTLADLLSATPSQAPTFRDAAYLIAQLADALQYAHEQGVVHRDVKPSNVMLESCDSNTSRSAEVSAEAPPSTPSRDSPSWRPRLMDFGLAKRDAGEITMTIDGQLLGTPAYIAPEQIRQAHEADGRSDVYSLGVMLYEMLCSELPFRGNLRMLLHQVQHDDPRPPRRLNDRIPRDLETICLKAMAKEPARRYATARDLADDLRRFLHGEPIRARPVSPLEQLYRWSHRNPAVAGLSVGIIVVLAIGTATSTHLAIKAQSKAHAEANMRTWADAESKRAKAAEEASTQQAERANKASKLAAQEASRANDALQQVRAASRRALRSHYLNQMTLIPRDWERSEVVRVRKRLDEMKPENTDGDDLRRFEWHYWDRRAAPPARIGEPSYRATGTAMSGDGRLLVTTSVDRKVTVWDSTSGAQLAAYPVPDGANAAMVASDARGELIAANFGEWHIIWDHAFGGRPVKFKHRQTNVSAIALSPDGKYLASADTGIKLWDSLKGTEVAVFTDPLASGNALPNKLLGDVIRTLQFAPDGLRLLSVSNQGSAIIWDTSTRAPTLRLADSPGKTSCAAIDASGRSVIAAIAPTGSIRAWNVTTGQEVLHIPRAHQGQIGSVAASHDDNWIVTAGHDHVVKIWNKRTGELRGSLRGHEERLTAAAFNSEDSRIISASNLDGGLRLWDAETMLDPVVYNGATGERASWKLETKSGHPDSSPVLGIAMSPKAQLIATPSGLWKCEGNIMSLESRWQSSSKLNVAIAFSPDGRFVASGGHTLDLWSVPAGKIQWHREAGHFHAVAFTPNGSQLWAAHGDGSIRGLDVMTGDVVSTLGRQEGSVLSIALHPTQDILVSGGITGLKTWNSGSHKEITLLDEPAALRSKGLWPRVECLAISPDGKWMASTGWEASMYIWDLHNGRQVHALGGHDLPVAGMHFSPDGNRFVSGGRDGKIVLWDVDTWQDLLTLACPPIVGPAIGFSSTSDQIISGHSDGTIRIWDARPSK